MKGFGTLVCFILGSQMLGAESQPALCTDVLTTLARSRATASHRASGNLVEIRSCDPGVLQIAAWGARGTAPLIVETNRTSIVSLATASDTVYVVETAGASSNAIQVIVFDHGVPRLALNEAGKAYADIRISWKEVVVTIAPDGEPPKSFRFATNIE